MIPIGPHPGWHGMFTTDEAEDAWPNGTRIVKSKMEPGDAHQVGALGTVLGSIRADRQTARRFGALYFYFVEFDDRPRVAVGVASSKIERG